KGIVLFLVGAVLFFPQISFARRVKDTDLLLELRETKTVGERINTIRQYRGLTQQILAGKLGVNRIFIAQLENDYQEITPSYFSRLAQELNIDAWLLLTGLPKEEALKEENLISNIPLIELALWGEERIIGERIKLARIALGLERQELAENLNIHHNYISAWERGRRAVPQDKIEILASVLEIPPQLLSEAKIPLETEEGIDGIKPVSFMGEIINDRREELYWPREKLAGLIGVDYSAIYSWETGFIDISTEKIPIVARALDVNVWVLLTGKSKDDALKRENLITLISPWELTKWGESRIIGERMKLARLTKGYSLNDLSKRMEERGINRNSGSLSMYERGIHPIPDEIISVLAHLLGLDPFQLQGSSVEAGNII
ncbi:MAG: helix-turn-helix domain-containing protein, partial [Candidatus Omnitrophica bacterium]|nr:helix-turn-helix domain-containing protein [Candidatus Omnitrophota bacterium]